MFLRTGFASETDLFPAGPIPAMEMFMPEPDLEDSFLEPDETTENDEVTIQATMPEPTVTPNSSAKLKDASSSSKKHKITQQDVQSMQIDVLRMEKYKIELEVENLELQNKKLQLEIQELQTRNQSSVSLN
jgi:hypothetical protein